MRKSKLRKWRNDCIGYIKEALTDHGPYFYTLAASSFFDYFKFMNNLYIFWQIVSIYVLKKGAKYFLWNLHYDDFYQILLTWWTSCRRKAKPNVQRSKSLACFFFIKMSILIAFKLWYTYSDAALKPPSNRGHWILNDL